MHDRESTSLPNGFKLVKRRWISQSVNTVDISDNSKSFSNHGSNKYTGHSSCPALQLPSIRERPTLGTPLEESSCKSGRVPGNTVDANHNKSSEPNRATPNKEVVSFSHLPLELQHRFVKWPRFDGWDMVRFERISSGFRRLLLEAWCRVQALDIDLVTAPDERYHSRLVLLLVLRSVNIEYLNFHLQTAENEDLMRNNTVFQAFGRCRHLYSVSLSATQLGDQHIHSGLEHLKNGTPFLRRIQFVKSTLSNESLEALTTAMPQLEAISLVSCWYITDTGIAKLSGCKHLNYLDVSYCRRITAASVSRIIKETCSRFCAEKGQVFTINISFSGVMAERLPRLIDQSPFHKIINLTAKDPSQDSVSPGPVKNPSPEKPTPMEVCPMPSIMSPHATTNIQSPSRFQDSGQPLPPPCYVQISRCANLDHLTTPKGAAATKPHPVRALRYGAVNRYRYSSGRTPTSPRKREFLLSPARLSARLYSGRRRLYFVQASSTNQDPPVSPVSSLSMQQIAEQSPIRLFYKR